MYSPPLRNHYVSILSSILGHDEEFKSSKLLQAYVTFSAMISAMYLKLVRMQIRLLQEPWTENLRQQVVAIRESYVEIIRQSHYHD